ncbi:helix-turn-helix domain-containing protein [Flaviflexus equikiangi]|uniref:GAF domain-containing protein n=1 Tax=Flaviflexus equikiangi TaxID=2758573 RepID=A0ABS2TDX8_9ACTO|nr:GAF domain-containing protein [Flaviflexus equikiangi]MBM9432517.1 GAF domain-containing protein [Flaviflexus equikiangi]
MATGECSTRVEWLEHRNRVLEAVTAIASLMAANHDIDMVLDRITALTRDLTNSDMAYISLNDAKETFIQYSTGVQTEGYRHIRMPLGTGVLGKAAIGRGTVQTADYLIDPSIIHLDNIDEIVRTEGVRAILGVPIRVHGALHGALLLANRTPGVFSPTIVDTVTTIAHHTAVALDQSRRFRAVSATLAGLRESFDDSAERLQALQTVVDLDALLSESLAQRRGLDHFAHTAAKALGSDLAILDAQGELAARGSIHGEPELPAFASELGRQAFISGRPAIRDRITATAATSNSEHLGSVIVFDPVPEQLLPRVTRTAVFLGILLLFERTQRGEERQRDQALIDDLLQRRKLTPSGAQRLEALLHTGPLSVAVLRTVGDSRTQLDRKTRDSLSFSAEHHGIDGRRFLSVEHHDHICILLPAQESEDILRSFISAMKSAAADVQCALGGRVDHATDFAQAHAVALTAMSALRALGHTNRIYRADDLGSLGIILAAQNADPHAYTPLSEIQALIDYDVAHGTELTRTAWLYSENHENIKITAGMLVVHENTVRQRLVRISELLGSNWQGSPRFLDIRLGLRIWALKTT